MVLRLTPPSRGRLLTSSAPTVSPGLVNSTTETTILSYTILAADSASAPNALRAKIGFDLLNNRGSATNYTFNFKLGGTTCATYTISQANQTTRVVGTIITDLLVASTSDQRWDVSHLATAAGGAALSTGNSIIVQATSTVDMTTDQAMAITVTMAAANALTDFRTYSTSLTRLR